MSAGRSSLGLKWTNEDGVGGDEDGAAADDEGVGEGCASTAEGDGELVLLIHPRGGEGAVVGCTSRMTMSPKFAQRWSP